MEIALTKRQEEILIGSVLGDGGIYTNGAIHSSSYYVKQSDRYREYVKWLFQEFRSVCISSPRQRKDNKQWYFGSRHLENFNRWRERFYQGRKKVVPLDIGQLLISPLSLAVWYMDDGSLDWRPKDHYNFAISTNAFSIEENKRLVETLRQNFGIEAAIHTPLCRGVRYPEIYIGVAGRDRFYAMIKPFVLKCFRKRLPPLRVTDPQRLRFLSR